MLSLVGRGLIYSQPQDCLRRHGSTLLARHQKCLDRASSATLRSECRTLGTLTCVGVCAAHRTPREARQHVLRICIRSCLWFAVETIRDRAQPLLVPGIDGSSPAKATWAYGRHCSTHCTRKRKMDVRYRGPRAAEPCPRR